MKTKPEKQVRELLIATTNKGKISEISSLLHELNYRLISLSDLPQTPPIVEETGETFAENAMIKAEYYHARSGLFTIADDSGLEVEALGGRPGVHSARYGGQGLSGLDQINLILDEMKDVAEEKRTARFVCAIALVGATSPISPIYSDRYSDRDPEPPVGRDLESNPKSPGIIRIFEGRCDGSIAFKPSGAGGFGYDPIFIDADSGRTFAELSESEKSARSHRGKALRSMLNYLEILNETSSE